MGYVYQRKTYRLIFEGDLAGLEVVAKSASATAYKRIAAWANREWASPLSDEDLAEFEAICRAFADVLLEWNLEEEHEVKGKTVRKAVARNVEALMDLDLDLLTRIVLAWLDSVVMPQAPVDEGSLPMEALS